MSYDHRNILFSVSTMFILNNISLDIYHADKTNYLKHRNSGDTIMNTLRKI
jgi:hypothetical protein